MTKKFLSLLLALLMVCSLVSGMAFAMRPLRSNAVPTS